MNIFRVSVESPVEKIQKEKVKYFCPAKSGLWSYKSALLLVSLKLLLPSTKRAFVCVSKMPKVVRKVSVGSAKKRAVVDRSSSSSESERAEREERDDEDERDEDNESFESIPRHIRLQIFSKLNELGDVANVCLTSREFNRTIETSERLWRRMLEMMIGQRQSEIIFSRRQIKERYVYLYSAFFPFF